MAILDARYDLAELTGTTDLIVQRLVSDQNLANIADALGITPHLAIWYQKGVEVSKRAKATTIEAIIGAVWFDSGKDLDAVKKILPALLGEELDAQKTDR
ncbi:uncharacterized protein RCC_12056 [Ramularia collo-cygni]|uniref:RNase III domain-containing protein n=1 Tax=Ramularia collo-cygni TaxID=112498 RepID=A0A2D3UWW8_9PEZI|nr:uncharacterized protein RCC_12056 [Ramularia collo-cygni]CZT14584.1 uncharacterized protein RCC_12056 [Ramularia collo-cygni]